MSKKINEEVNRSTFTLYYNEQKSFFKKNKLIPIYNFEYKLAEIFTRSHHDWHQFNGIDRWATHHTKILSKNYRVNYSSKMKKWELSNEVKIIDGYTCYKAVKYVY